MGCGCCPLRNRSDFINASIKYVWSSFPVEYLVSFFIEQIHPNLDFCMVLTKWYNPHSCTRINFINVLILINFDQYASTFKCWIQFWESNDNEYWIMISVNVVWGKIYFIEIWFVNSF